MEDPPSQSSSGGAPAAAIPDATIASAVAGFASDTAAAESQPVLREDQIVNAVSFLSHPKVRGSAESAKRTFLEKKGLTAAEIEDAFKRVPPEAPAATSSTPTVGANNLVTYTQQPQQAMHVPQHATVVAPQALVPAQQMVQRPPVHWSQVVLGVGVAAAGLYGLHQLLYPRLSAWSHQLFSARSAAAEAEAERTAALTAALERLSEGQTRLQQSLDSLASAVSRQQQRPDQLGYAESQADYLALPGPSSHTKRSQQQQYNSIDTYASSSRAAAVRGGGWDPYAPESSQHLPSDGRPGSAASPSGRFAQGNPSGFYGSSATGFEVTPPPMGNYRAPQPPAQYGNASNISNNAGPSGADPGYARRTGAYAGPEASAAGSSAVGRPEEAPRSAAFHEVMAMVQAGITPPNVRTDIDDTPPDPSRPLSAPQMPPRAKPWEAGTVSSNVLGTPGAAYSSNVVPDGPSGFGVRGYGGAPTAAPVTPTSAPRADASNSSEGGPSMRPAGADASSTAAAGSSSSGFEAPAQRAGYDLSQLLGPDSARDAPWRPPPPPAATVQRPVSSGSTTQQPLVAAASAPPAAVAPVAPEADVQAAVLAGAESAPPGPVPTAAGVDGAADAVLAAAAPGVGAVPQLVPQEEGGAAVVAEGVEQVA